MRYIICKRYIFILLVVFHFLVVTFKAQNIKILMMSNLSVFFHCLCFWCFGVISKKTIVVS